MPFLPISIPFKKGDVVRFKQSRWAKKRFHLPPSHVLLRVTKCWKHKHCQSGFLVNVKSKSVFTDPVQGSPVSELLDMDSSWFVLYEGGTVLAGDENERS